MAGVSTHLGRHRERGSSRAGGCPASLEASRCVPAPGRLETVRVLVPCLARAEGLGGQAEGGRAESSPSSPAV